MTLLQRQQQLLPMVCRLVAKALSLGEQVTGGDLYRDPRAPYGHPHSLHRVRLAIDLNLFRDGRYITDAEGHKELHEFWESLGGSPMIEDDANHYSLPWEGMK